MEGAQDVIPENVEVKEKIELSPVGKESRLVTRSEYRGG